MKTYVSSGGIKWQDFVIRTEYCDDGSRLLNAESFPDAIAVAPELLEHADNRWLNTDDECITFTLTNGVARYRIAEIDNTWGRELLICQQVNSLHDAL